MQTEQDVPADAACMLAASTAALLRSVLALRSLSASAAALSFLGVLMGVLIGRQDALPSALLVAAALLVLPVLYLMLRVDFDARLFEMLAAQRDMSEAMRSLDVALKTLGLIKDASPRSLEDRVAGGRRLAMRALGLVGLQLALLVASAIACAVGG